MSNFSEFNFLPDGGETGALLRSISWDKHPLGPVKAWPANLKTSLGTLFHSPHPMFIWWGKELIQFYNDAYLPSIRNGKHPLAMGQRGEECWPEIWPIIWPQINDVLNEGKASWNENQLVPIYRNGKLEDAYWTYGYSAIFGDNGNIDGVLVVCTETTQQVYSTEKLKNSEKKLRESEMLIRNSHQQLVIANQELVFQNEEKERRAADLAIANQEREKEILFNASRMSSLGEMASGIAHEINNPLSIIIMKGSQLIRKYETDTLDREELEQGLMKITSTAQRIGKVVKGLSSISRNSEKDLMTKMRLDKVIEETLQLCRERFNSFSIKLHVDLAAINGIEIEGRASQIMQVLLNLLNNAIDAVMPLAEKWVAVKAIPNDFGVVVTVTDSGHGISDALLAKLMQPFFTTKEPGMGTGLGLSISKQMIDEHQGQFYYQKNSNHTCFVIELPYAQKPANV